MPQSSVMLPTKQQITMSFFEHTNAHHYHALHGLTELLCASTMLWGFTAKITGSQDMACMVNHATEDLQ